MISRPHASEPCPARTYNHPDARPHVPYSNCAECMHCGCQLGDRVRTAEEIEAAERAAEIEEHNAWHAEQRRMRDHDDAMDALHERAGLTPREAAEMDADPWGLN